MVDPQIAEVLRAVLLLGVALLAFREFRRIRGEINERKDRERRDKLDRDGDQ